MESAKAIGIDIGKSKCCVALYHRDYVKILLNEEGSRITPNHAVLDLNKNSKEISSLLLEKMKKIASKCLSENVTEVVISVPTYFNYFQRAAIKHAASLAGLSVIRLLNASTAAAIAHCLEDQTKDQIGNEKNVMVINVSSDTTGVAILNTDGDLLTVEGTSNDKYLGSQDFSNNLLQRSEKPRLLLSQSRRMKIILKSITRQSMFKKRLNKFFKKSIEGSRMKFEKLNEIVLVGGTEDISIIENNIRNTFIGGRLRMKRCNNQAVANGAALHAAMLAKIHSNSLRHWLRSQRRTNVHYSTQK